MRLVTTKRAFITVKVCQFFSLALLQSCLALLLCCLSLCPPASAGETASCLSVFYSSKPLGARKCLIGPNCVRIENPNSGVTIVCAAPDWNVCSYNVRSKLYYRSTIDNFPGEAYDKISAADIYTLTHSSWLKTTVKTFKNRPCRVYKMHRTPKSIKSSVGSSLVVANYLVFEDYSIAPQAQKILAKVLHLPQEPGIPMMLHFFDQDDAWVEALICRKIETVSAPKDSFNLPSGYKLSKNDQAVFVDPMSKSVFQGLNDFTEKLAH